MSDKCCGTTPIRMEICPPGVDCEEQKILDMYGYQGRVKPLGDCEWSDLPVIIHPVKHFDFGVDKDGEYEFQWRSLRHGVKWSPGSGKPDVYSTVPSPFSDSTVFSVAVAPPIQGSPAKVVLSPKAIC